MLQRNSSGRYILKIVLQSSINKPYNSSSYAMDAVMTLALALNKTLENPSINLSLQRAIQAVMFSGASVSIRSSTYIYTNIWVITWHDVYLYMFPGL